MPARPDVPDEAVEAAASELFNLHGPMGTGTYEKVHRALKAATPVIRKQERERVREGLKQLPRYGDGDAFKDDAWKIDLAAALAALDTLEDSDG